MSEERLKELGNKFKNHRRALRNPRVGRDDVARELSRSVVWVDKFEQGNIQTSEMLISYMKVIRMTPEEQQIVFSNYADVLTIKRTLTLSLDIVEQLSSLAKRLNIGEEQLMKNIIEEGISKMSCTNVQTKAVHSL